MSGLRIAALSATSFIALTAAAEAGVVQGRVSAARGAVSLDGAIITIVETGAKVSTGRDGRFRVAGLPAGEYTVTVRYLGAETVTQTATLESDDATVTVDFGLGEDVQLVDNILVVGQRGALASALNQQRASDNLVTVLSSDAIGSLPDQNVAEAARRAVGVQVLNDQGEGRFVSIRGAAPNLNAVTINGVRVPSPEAGSRSLPLDVIDSDLLDSIVITKSLRPDMDGDAIGGSIDIKSLSAFDYDGVYFKAKLAGIYTDQVDEYGEKASFAAANQFMDGRLGVAGSFSYQRRDFGSENIEVDGDFFEAENGVAIPVPGELELRDYQVERERLSAAINLDFLASETTSFYLRTLYSDFSDQEYRNRIEYKLDEDDGSVVGRANAANTAVRDDTIEDLEEAGIEIDRDLKDRLESQVIFSAVLGGEYENGAITFDWSAAYSHAEEEEPDRLDTAFRSEGDAFNENPFGVNLTDLTLPRLSLADAEAAAAFVNPDLFELDEYEAVDGLSEDDELAFTADFKYDTEIFGAPGYIKTGAKVRLREKTYGATVDVYSGDGTALTGLTTSVDYGLDTFGPGINPAAIRSLFAQQVLSGDAEFEELDSALASTVEDYEANEDIFAAYAMAKADFGPLRVLGGLRVEATEYDAKGFEVAELEEDASTAGFEDFDIIAGDPADFVIGGTATDDLALARGTSNELSYTDVLPSLNLRYEASEDLIFRGAYYASVVRPEIEAAAPTVELAINDDDEVEGAAGNPELERQKAHNIDLSMEWYPTSTSSLTAGVFYKSIDDFIAETIDDSGTAVVNGITFDELESFANLDDAELFGIELGYRQALTMLPAPFDGFVVGANYTYVDSEVTRNDGTKSALPQQSEQIANLILGYEHSRFDLRAALTFRDEYIDEIGVGDSADRVVLDHLQLDLQGSVAITDQFKAFFQATNLNDEAFHAVLRGGEFGVDRLSQFEEYGWWVQFGLQYKF